MAKEKRVKLTVELIVSTLMFSGFADGTTNRKLMHISISAKNHNNCEKKVSTSCRIIKNVTGKIIGNNKFS